MKKCMLVLLAGAVLVFSQVAVASAAIVLKFGHKTAVGGTMDRQAHKFKELVEARSQGQIKIDIYPANQLGEQRDQLEGVSAGYIDIFMEGVGSIAQFDKDMSFVAADFMFKTNEEMKNNPVYKELIERIRKKNGIRTLAVEGTRPPFEVWTIKKPIRTLADLKGVKFRALPTKASIDVWNGLGATATMIPWGETYMALSQGVLDGMTHNVVQIKDEKFYERLKYVSLVSYPAPASTNALFINEAKFQSLSPQHQKLLEEAGVEAGKFFTTMMEAEEKAAWEVIKKAGIEIIKVDRDPWFAKAEEAHKKMEERGEWSKGFLQRKGK